jgi:hypothetical protein
MMSRPSQIEVTHCGRCAEIVNIQSLRQVARIEYMSEMGGAALRPYDAGKIMVCSSCFDVLKEQTR